MQNANLMRTVVVMFPLAFLFIYLLYYQSPLFFELHRNNSSPNFNNSCQLSSGLIFIGNSDEELNLQMSPDSVDIAFFKFVSRRHFICKNSIRLGKALDGGWDMCLVEPYRPKQPCVIYSFGINDDFSFDDAAAANFNCTVRCFDPSMKVADHRRSANVWFYKMGIDGKNTIKGQWTMRTLSSIVDSMNDTNKTIDYLKMDVENSEWPSLVQIFSSGSSLLSKVKQFGLEIHVDTSREGLVQKFKILKQLEDAGFRRWYFRLNYYHLRQTSNGFRSCCYEMVYINTRYLNPT